MKINAKIIKILRGVEQSQLRESDKIQNQLISKVRVVVEHVIGGIKRLHIVKAVFRNTKDGYEDQVIELACGLHNFRSDHRFSY